MRRDAEVFSSEAAENIAISALSYLAGDDERLDRLLALTGMSADSLRDAAREPAFLTAILDYVASDQRLMQTFAEHAGISPAGIDAARRRLAGDDWERESA